VTEDPRSRPSTAEEAIELRRALVQRHGFTPDPFQEEAFSHIDAGSSVLVAAPTSAGKTLAAEYAIARARSGRGTVAYTTPIKALSNQKLGDLSSWLGIREVGLLTGDNVVRGDAPVVVMTTEVLRNMIYAGSDRLNDLAVVVLDEVHYLQDPYRGPVWEEVIIQLPPHVQLICLSATVSNAQEVADWIASVRGRCEVVVETERPVALHDHFLIAERGARRLREFRTVRDGRPNEEVTRFLVKAGGESVQRGRQEHRRKGTKPARPRRTEIVAHLDERDRLPAIFFVFSRQGCDDAVRQCVEAGIGFLDGREQRRVEEIAEQHVKDLSAEDLVLLGYRSWLTSLQTGIAAHHAGMVTPFKEAVEDCFKAGLMHVVFATETLALGVNLPARSVVIESLTRYRGEGHVMLTPGEYTQLTGRAGRRGTDAAGHAYTLWNPYTGFRETAELVASTKFELSSAFRPTYNMAANLISTRTRDDAVGLLHRSFAQFRADRRIVGWTANVDKAKVELQSLSRDHKTQYGDSSARPAHRAPIDASKVSAALKKLQPGDVIVQPRQHGSAHLLVIGTTSRKGGENRIRVAGMRGKTLMLAPADFDQLPVALDNIDLPKPYAPNRREFHRAAARVLRQFVQDTGLEVAPSRARGGDTDTDSERRALERKIERVRGRLAGLEHQVRTARRDLGSTLDSIVNMLNELRCADGWQLTPAGELLTGLFHERDLPLALAISKGLFDGLTPPELASLASTLSYEHRGRHAPPAPWFPTNELKRRATEIERILTDVQRRESHHSLNQTIGSSPGFAAIAHGWASGIGLRDLLAAEDIGAGDFVRNIRQLVDLLRQISEVAPDRLTAACAREAVRAIDRGVVAAATRLSDAPEDDIAKIAELIAEDETVDLPAQDVEDDDE